MIEELAERHAANTVFTRFIPARSPGEGRGAWARYYQRWSAITLDEVDPRMIGLMPSLARLVPPAMVVDKNVYSPWTEGTLDGLLRNTNVHTLIITGGETDICVLATLLGAIDRGFRVILAEDAMCSSFDQTHDALMELYHSRFSQQVEIADTETILSNWQH